MTAVDVRHRAVSPDAAVERLMDAAERLIATMLGAGVSDRAIITEAGQHNNSAITYHFGSRRGLMDAVWHRRQRRIADRRDELVGELQQPIGRLEVPEVVTLYIQPLCDEIGSQHPSHWARFNEHFLQDLPLNFIPWVRPDMSRFEGTASSDQLLELFERLRELLTAIGLPLAMAETRVALAARFVIASLAGWERSVASGDAVADELPALRDDLIAMTVALLKSTPSGTGRWSIPIQSSRPAATQPGPASSSSKR
ncbi:MAG: TetR/AcrR family transcriptional regulator [Nakamurella sp.]